MVSFLFRLGFSTLIRSTIFTRSIHHYRNVSTQISGIMKLYSDRGNPLLLRILAARDLAGIQLTVHLIDSDGKSSVLLWKWKRKWAVPLRFYNTVHGPFKIFACEWLLLQYVIGTYEVHGDNIYCKLKLYWPRQGSNLRVIVSPFIIH